MATDTGYNSKFYVAVFYKMCCPALDNVEYLKVSCLQDIPVPTKLKLDCRGMSQPGPQSALTKPLSVEMELHASLKKSVLSPSPSSIGPGSLEEPQKKCFSGLNQKRGRKEKDGEAAGWRGWDKGTKEKHKNLQRNRPRKVGSFCCCLMYSQLDVLFLKIVSHHKGSDSNITHPVWSLQLYLGSYQGPRCNSCDC